ncbi:MAG: hypothetical protein IJF73_00605 [Clostridia bacterium]|nr:hypothetical protein [Clostridia bacterium]
MSKRLLFRALGYLFCLVPPILAILERFPLWAREGSASVISGLSLLLLLVAAIPLRRGLLSLCRRFLSSPSAFTVWGILWLLCEWLGHILTAVADIALVATVSSFVGAIFFRLSIRGESV